VFAEPLQVDAAAVMTKRMAWFPAATVMAGRTARFPGVALTVMAVEAIGEEAAWSRAQCSRQMRSEMATVEEAWDGDGRGGVG
jgi:hypothetical protein